MASSTDSSCVSGIESLGSHTATASLRSAVAHAARVEERNGDWASERFSALNTSMSIRSESETGLLLDKSRQSAVCLSDIALRPVPADLLTQIAGTPQNRPLLFTVLKLFDSLADSRRLMRPHHLTCTFGR